MNIPVLRVTAMGSGAEDASLAIETFADKEIAQNLRMILKKRGVKLLFDAALQSITQAGEELQYQSAVNGKSDDPCAICPLCGGPPVER